MADKRTGSGTVRYANGDTFTGPFSDNKKGPGYGEFKYVNGDTYKGQWSADRRHGVGQYVYTSGDTFTGTFIRGKKDGAGQLTRVSVGDGDVAPLEGVWKADRQVKDERSATFLLAQLEEVLHTEGIDAGVTVDMIPQFLKMQRKNSKKATDEMRAERARKTTVQAPSDGPPGLWAPDENAVDPTFSGVHNQQQEAAAAGQRSRPVVAGRSRSKDKGEGERSKSKPKPPVDSQARREAAGIQQDTQGALANLRKGAKSAEKKRAASKERADRPDRIDNLSQDKLAALAIVAPAKEDAKAANLARLKRLSKKQQSKNALVTPRGGK